MKSTEFIYSGDAITDLDVESFVPPTTQEIVAVLRAHPLIKLKEKVFGAFLIGSFAKNTPRRGSDVDILLHVKPRPGYTSEELEDKYRQALRQYFVTHDIRGQNDSIHPQWMGRRVDLYFTYDPSTESRPKLALQ